MAVHWSGRSTAARPGERAQVLLGVLAQGGAVGQFGHRSCLAAAADVPGRPARLWTTGPSPAAARATVAPHFADTPEPNRDVTRPPHCPAAPRPAPTLVGCDSGDVRPRWRWRWPSAASRPAPSPRPRPWPPPRPARPRAGTRSRRRPRRPPTAATPPPRRTRTRRPAASARAARRSGAPGCCAARTCCRRTSQPLPGGLTARAWVLADLDTGDVLAARDPHGRYPAASIQKILTTVTLLPLLPGNRTVTVTRAAAETEGSHAGLVPGGRYTVDQLFRALLLVSGNDAAAALADAAGGRAADRRPDECHRPAARRLRHVRPDALRTGRLAAADQRLRHDAVPARRGGPAPVRRLRPQAQDPAAGPARSTASARCRWTTRTSSS